MFCCMLSIDSFFTSSASDFYKKKYIAIYLDLDLTSQFSISWVFFVISCMLEDFILKRVHTVVVENLRGLIMQQYS